MAAQNGMNTTTMNDVVKTEAINPNLIPAANFLRVYEAIAWVAPVPAGGATYKWPRWDAVAVSGTHTESDELSATNFPTSVESVTGAVVGVHALATDQLLASSGMVTVEMQVGQMMEELRNRIDKDVLGALVGATNTSDNTGSNLSLDLFDTALAAFKAQKPNMPRIVFIGSTNQVRDLRKAIRASGNGGLIMGAGLSVFEGQKNAGYQGDWGGIEIYEGNTTQADADNDTGGFVAAAPMGSWFGAASLDQGGEYQRGSGLGIAMWPLGGVYGPRPEAIRVPERVGLRLVASAMYGAAVTADHLVRAFISKKAAA